MIRRLRLEGDPVDRGRAHGTAFAGAIRRYTEERVHLACNGTWAGRPATRADILGLAEAMLPAHRAYAPALYAEMVAMAQAAGISAAEAVVVGGFTDFVDAVRAMGGPAVEEDDCTAVVVPGAPAWFAQTWDMHDSATEHVVLLGVRPDDGPVAEVFTTAGCVGQIGMNAAGLTVGINNLTGADGRVGVTWPFVVREALRETTAEAALRRLTAAPLAGAHAYLLLDAQGAGFMVEAFPTTCVVTPLEGAPLVHTNHCLSDAAARLEAPRAAELVASSVDRLGRAQSRLAEAPADFDRLVALTRDPVICRRSAPPFHLETSGAVITRPATRELWAVWGLPTESEYERVVVGDG